MDTTVRATCPQCKTGLRIPSQWLGQAIKCKKCGTVVRTKARNDGGDTAANLEHTQTTTGPTADVDHGAFDFNGAADEGDGTFPGQESPADNGWADPAAAPAAPPLQPVAPPPGYPYPMPPGYAPPGAGAYGAPPGYPSAPPPGYPYAPPPGYPPAPGYLPPGAYGAPPVPGYPYPVPPGVGPVPPGAPASGVYHGAPPGAPPVPGYPYPMPPGAGPIPPAAPPSGVYHGAPPAAPASGAYYGAAAGAPPAPSAPVPKVPAPASGVMSGGTGAHARPPKPASGTGMNPRPVAPKSATGVAPRPQPAAAPKPAAQSVPNSAFRTDIPTVSPAAARRKKSGQNKLIYVAITLVLTGGLVTASIIAAKKMNDKAATDPVAKVTDPYKLVEYLGSDDARERDTATKLLRDMGDKAEAALKDGTRSPNPDIAKRAAELFTAVKAAPSTKDHARAGPFPRRMLFIHVSKYMFLNPLTAGQPGGEDRSRGSAIRLANEWNVPFDPKDHERNQLFVLSDTARPENTKNNDTQTPMRNVVMGAYESFFNTSRAQDRIVVYFGGHALEIDGKPYLAPIEGDPDDPEPTLIPLSDFYDKMKACKATQKIVIWDVCRFNPQRGRQRPGSEPMGEGLYKALAAAPAGVEAVITCQPGENALEFFNLQVESGASGGTKFAGSAFLESMKHVAAKGARTTTAKQPVPTDPIPLAEWAAPIIKRVADMAAAAPPTEKEPFKQGMKLEGKGPPTWVAFNPDEPLAKRFEFPHPPKGINPSEIAAIVNELNVPPIKSDLIDAGLAGLPFREDAMKDYKSAVTADMVNKDKDTYKFQAKTLATFDKIRALWTPAPGTDGPKLRDDFKAPVNDALKTEIKKEQDFWALGIAELELMNAELDGIAPMRESADKRWQAQYDYARATLKARLAFMNEYNKVLGNVLTETLPALDAKLGQDSYKLTSAEKMKSGKDVQAIAAEAKETYNKLVADHKGTPWAIQAKRDKAFSLGLAWQPISSGTTPP